MIFFKIEKCTYLQTYCNENRKPYWKQCGKHFPKDFTDNTQMGDRNYPELRRPDDGQKCTKKTNNKRVEATNRHVVPYNPFLLSKYRCHMNVEVISSLKVVKYIYKYLYKGFDRALVEAAVAVDDDDASSYGTSGQMNVFGHVLYPKTIKMPPGALLVCHKLKVNHYISCISN